MAKKLTARQMLNWWLDPKNGKVGIEYLDKKTMTNKKTKGFHAVTSGFNDLIQQYYGTTGKEFIDDAVAKKLISIKPLGRGKTGKGIPGVMVYPYSEFTQGNKAEGLMAEMGIS
tara:strand:+ start:246 stop:587 length:342 start_codon:yes stop_codon:yes gene_type:complete